jgi:hypothetical protein
VSEHRIDQTCCNSCSTESGEEAGQLSLHFQLAWRMRSVRLSAISSLTPGKSGNRTSPVLELHFSGYRVNQDLAPFSQGLRYTLRHGSSAANPGREMTKGHTHPSRTKFTAHV